MQPQGYMDLVQAWLVLKGLMQEAFLLLDSVAFGTQCHDFVSLVLSARLELAKFAMPVNMTGARLGVQDLLLEG